MTHETADRYRVSLIQEDEIWLIETVDLQGVRSFGRTVKEAARSIREAIAAAEDLDHWDELDLAFALADQGASAGSRAGKEIGELMGNITARVRTQPTRRTEQLRPSDCHK